MGFDGRQPGDNPALEELEKVRAERDKYRKALEKALEYLYDEDVKLGDVAEVLEEVLGV